MEFTFPNAFWLPKFQVSGYLFPEIHDCFEPYAFQESFFLVFQQFDYDIVKYGTP